MHELYPDIRVTGEILLDERNIFKMNPMEVRRMAGMVFQRPNLFPTMSIYDNVLAGYKLNGIRLSKAQKDEIVETSPYERRTLERSARFAVPQSEDSSPADSSNGCASPARSRWKPEVLLMDEPTSALDPIATHRVEELMLELKKEFTIVIVTHNMAQAARISDYSLFMYLGELVESGRTQTLFTTPKDKRPKSTSPASSDKKHTYYEPIERHRFKTGRRPVRPANRTHPETTLHHPATARGEIRPPNCATN